VRKCSRFLWVLWRQHCWHSKKVENVFFGDCKIRQDGVESRCCKCGETHMYSDRQMQA
jgi:hypothetical protein